MMPFRPRDVLRKFLHREAEFEAGAHPRVQIISPPKISWVSFSQFAEAAIEMIAFGCMWST